MTNIPGASQLSAMRMTAYANDIISRNQSNSRAVERFKQILTGIDYTTITTQQMDSLWLTALQQTSSSPTQPGFISQPAYQPSPTQPIGQPLNPPGVPYAPQPTQPYAPSTDFSSINAQLAALASQRQGLDTQSLMAILNQIEASHAAQINQITSRYIDALQQVLASDTQDDNAFLTEFKQIARTLTEPTAPGAIIQPKEQAPAPKETTTQYPIDIASIEKQLLDEASNIYREKNTDVLNKLSQAWEVIQKQAEIYGPLTDKAVQQFVSNALQQNMESILKGTDLFKEFIAGTKGGELTPELDFWQTLTKFFSKAGELLNNPGDKATDFILAKQEAARQSVVDTVEQQKKKLDNIINKLQAGDYTSWHEVIDDFSAMGGSGSLLQGLLNFGILLTFPVRAILAGGEPIASELKHLSQAEHPVQLLDPQSYVIYLLRSPTQRKWAMEQLGKLGLNESQISALVTASLRIVPPDQIIAAKLRNFIDTNTADRLLGASGFDDENKKIIEELAQFIPPINDQIMFLVKEAYNEDAIRRYQLDSPEYRQLIDIGRKIGLSEEWIRRYWIAHWQYPSPNQVMEMWHRRNSEPELKGFSQQDVDEYLKVADYSPAWRPRLRAISFNPLGRIDVRRIYKAGGKSDEWLKVHYEANGYNEQDVRDLVEWTKNTQLPEDESELSKLNDKVQSTLENRYLAGAINATEASNILRYLGKSDMYISKALPALDLIRSLSGLHNETQDLAVKVKAATLSAKTRGNISNTQAKRLLVSTGMSDEQATLNLHYADLQYQVKLKEQAQNTYQTQYAVHNIDESEFRSGLSGYEFTKDEIDKAFMEAQLMRVNKTKKPTEAQLEKWYKNGTINDAQLQDELRGLGLSEKYVQVIYQDIVKQ